MSMSMSRRSFLSRASATSAALASILAVPRLLATAPAQAHAAGGSIGSSQASTASPSLAVSSEPVFAYVRDLMAGEIAVFIGDKEIVRRDPELVSRLLSAGA
jgi:hypothetical protein